MAPKQLTNVIQCTIYRLPNSYFMKFNFSNSLAVLRVFLPLREKFVPSHVIFLFSVSDWIFERS